MEDRPPLTDGSGALSVVALIPVVVTLKIDVVPELLTERTVLTTFAALAVLGMFVMLCRARRVSTSVEDATLKALHRVTNAAPYLRQGLTQESADKAAPHLRELLACVAVGVVDAEATLLSWDGEANHHYEHLRPQIE